MSGNQRYTLLENLVERLADLPSIGRKSAQRLAFYLLSAPEAEVEALSNALLQARRGIHPCTICGNHAEGERCGICSDSRRDQSLICVVERPADILAFERLAAFRGVYHVLGGVLSPLDGIGPSEINLQTLFTRCESGVVEIVLALGTHSEGEATSAYILQRLQSKPVKVTRLARGLPAGSDLEFVDEITIRRALEGRVDLAPRG